MSPISNAFSRAPWPLVAIGAPTGSAIEPAEKAAGYRPPNYKTHPLSSRDPGASNAKLGGGIVGGLTLGILLFLIIITCCHSRSPLLSPPSSRSSSPPTSTHSFRNRVPPTVPVVVRVTKNKEERDDEESHEGKIKKPEYAWTKRRPPKGRERERADWHPPPAHRHSRSGRLDTVELPPAAGTFMGYIA